MAMTPDELQALLEGTGLKVKRHGDEVVFGFQTRAYRDRDGDLSLMMVAALPEGGEYFTLFAPGALKVSGPHADAALRACMMFQWRTKMMQFEYDARDGEVRPIIEFPLEDNRLTERQVRRCIAAMVRILDEFHGPFTRALQDGVIDFGDGGGPPDRRAVLEQMIQELEASNAPAEQVAVLKALLEKLRTPPSSL